MNDEALLSHCQADVNGKVTFEYPVAPPPVLVKHSKSKALEFLVGNIGEPV